MKTLAFVFARGGSKGIPRKNLQDLGGRPLIGHAITCALATPGVERVIVSTDDTEIADVARAFGADVPFLRPAELATDRAPEILAWQHALGEAEARYGAFDVMLSVPTTAPLREPSDLRRVLEAFVPGETDFVITVTPARRSPFFNMVTVDDAGFARLAAEGAAIATRQEAPKVYDMTTVAYAAAPEFVRSGQGLFTGRVRAVEVPAERALDLDEPLDLEIARFLWSRRAAESGTLSP
jgi:N-acylneuraminate cytidylyltransferase